MLKLTLVTPEKKMFVDLVVEEVFVPGYRGELNILPGHTPLVTVLDTGVLKFKNSSTNETVVAAISWGYCEVRNDNVNILAETAELPRDIDFHRAKDALKLSEEVLVKGEGSLEELQKFLNKLKRARTRISISTPSK